MKTIFGGASALMCFVLFTACGDDNSGDKGADRNEANAEQTPPVGSAKLEAWLEQGSYRDWHCESSPHAARAPSPHGFNRICSNDLLSDNVKGSAPWPKGAAAVKELYAAADDQEPVGYAVYLKTDRDSADGANWYWYERVSSDPSAAPSKDDVLVDGMGDVGPAKASCVSCHAAAGSDAAHTPTQAGRDQVYTPVM